MIQSDSFQGFKNYQTWLTINWINETPSLYDTCFKLVEQYTRIPKGTYEELTESICEFAHNVNSLPRSWANDIIIDSLGRVDWLEVTNYFYNQFQDENNLILKVTEMTELSNAVIIIISDFENFPKLFKVEPDNPYYDLAVQSNNLIVGVNDNEYTNDVVCFITSLNDEFATQNDIANLSKSFQYLHDEQVRLVNVGFIL